VADYLGGAPLGYNYLGYGLYIPGTIDDPSFRSVRIARGFSFKNIYVYKQRRKLPYFDSSVYGNSVSSGIMGTIIQSLIKGNSLSSGQLRAEYKFIMSGRSISSGVMDTVILAALIDYACYVLNTVTKRTYNFDTYNYKGIGRFNGKLIGARGNIIYDLETVATLDNATAITSYLEFKTDFGLAGYTELRSLYVEDDTVTITITDASGNVIANNITPLEFRGLPKNLISTAFTIKIANISGEQIILRRVHGKLNVIARKGD